MVTWAAETFGKLNSVRSTVINQMLYLEPNKLQIGDPNVFETMAFCNLQEEYVNVNDPGKTFFRWDIVGAALSTGMLLMIALIILSD